MLYSTIYYLSGIHADAVIQAMGRAEFEDDLRTRIQFELRNGLQRVFNITKVNLIGQLVCKFGTDPGGVDQNPTWADKLRIGQIPHNQWYGESPNSADLNSVVPGLVRFQKRTKLSKFPDIVRFLMKIY